MASLAAGNAGNPVTLLTLLTLVKLPGIGLFLFLCFLDHATVLDPLAHDFSVLRRGHWGNGHQVLELRGVAVITFHKLLESPASLHNKVTMLLVLL